MLEKYSVVHVHFQHDKKYIWYYYGGSSCAEQGEQEMKTGLVLHKWWKEGPFVTKIVWTNHNYSIFLAL